MPRGIEDTFSSPSNVSKQPPPRREGNINIMYVSCYGKVNRVIRYVQCAFSVNVRKLEPRLHVRIPRIDKEQKLIDRSLHITPRSRHRNASFSYRLQEAYIVPYISLHSAPQGSQTPVVGENAVLTTFVGSPSSRTSYNLWALASSPTASSASPRKRSTRGEAGNFSERRVKHSCQIQIHARLGHREGNIVSPSFVVPMRDGSKKNF